MSGRTREQIYNGICIFCIVLCIILIGRVAADELTQGRGKENIHRPPEVRTKDTYEGIILTEEYVTEEIKKYLPSELPLENIEVDIAKDGLIQISGSLGKKKLEAMLEDFAVNRAAGVLIPGEETAFELAFKCSCDGESGLLMLEPRTLKAGDIELRADAIPVKVLNSINEGVNRLLMAAGISFCDISFSDNGIILK